MNNKLRIAMIGQKHVPSRFGGIDVVVSELSTHLVSSGHSVLLFNRKRKKSERQTEYNGASIKECFTINRRSVDALIYSYIATLKAKRLANKGKLDVVHFHSEGVCRFLSFFPKREKRNYKIVVTVHGIDSLRAKWAGLGSKVLKDCEKQIAKYADEIIVLNSSDKEYFKKHFNKETTLIPNAVEETKPILPELIKENWGLEKDKYILTVARLVPEKGIHYLVQAFQNIDKEIKKDYKLVIAGSYSQDKKYYGLIQNLCKNDSSVVLTDFVEGQALKELYSNAKLFVLPSELEGMSMSLLEALSYKLDCLVSDIKENTEVLRGAGLTFSNKNVKSLQEKLTAYIKGEESASTTNVKLLDWQTITEKTAEIYYK